MEVQLHTFFPLALDGGQWPALRLGRFYPTQKSFLDPNQPTNWLTYSIQQSSSFCLAIPCLLLILKALYCVYSSPHLVPVLSQVNPPSYPISIRHILILYFQIYRDLPNAFFPSGFPAKTLYAFLSSPMHATCTNHVTVIIITCTQQSLPHTVLNNILHGKVSNNRIQPRALPYLSVVTDNMIGRSGRSLSVNETWTALCEKSLTVNSNK